VRIEPQMRGRVPRVGGGIDDSARAKAIGSAWPRCRRRICCMTATDVAAMDGLGRGREPGVEQAVPRGVEDVAEALYDQ
jgi:hypothetical protein